MAAPTKPSVLTALVVTLALLAVTLPGPAFGWRQEIDGQNPDELPGYETAWDVVADASGDVIAVGTVSIATRTSLFVAKFEGDSGAEIWRYEGARNVAPVVTLDGAGDVLVTHLILSSDETATSVRLAVVKLAGGSGLEIWRREIVISTNGSDAPSIAVDGAGDVFVAGPFVNGGGNRFTVVKLSGADGSDLWRTEIAGRDGASSALAIDGSGDVIAAGTTSDPMVFGANFVTAAKFDGGAGGLVWQYDRTFAAGFYASRSIATTSTGDVVFGGSGESAVVKVAGGTGVELWHHEQTRNVGGQWKVAVDQNDDVLAAGSDFVGDILDPDDWSADFSVVKLASGDGSVVWRRNIDGNGQSKAFGNQDFASDVAVDGAGDVMASGTLRNGVAHGLSKTDFTVAKIAGGDGAVVWLQEIDGRSVPSSDAATAVAVDGQGNAVVAGTMNRTLDLAGDFAVAKLNGVDGTVGPVRGQRLVVQDRAGDPTRRRVIAILRDQAVRVPPGGSTGDPSLAGARLTLVNPSTTESASFVLPAGAAWKKLGIPAGSRGYLYRDARGTNGPCSLVRVVPGGLLKADCSGRLGTVPFDLDEATQGSLTLSLQLGAGGAQCGTFGGTVRTDAGTATPGPNGAFKALYAPAPLGGCPAP